MEKNIEGIKLSYIRDKRFLKDHSKKRFPTYDNADQNAEFFEDADTDNIAFNSTDGIIISNTAPIPSSETVNFKTQPSLDRRKYYLRSSICPNET